jgi:hypothetical protein
MSYDSVEMSAITGVRVSWSNGVSLCRRLRRSDISNLIGWTDRVLLPIKPMKPLDLSDESGYIVAFDTEDFPKRRIVVRQSGRVSIVTSERRPLGTTFTTKINGQVVTDCWDIERPVTLEELEQHVRDFLKTNGAKNWARGRIYLVSHYSPAELRHVSNWTRVVKPENICMIGNDKIHLTTNSLTLVDSFAFFQKGLKAVARFVGMEKIELGKRSDGDDWIGHMDELKKTSPKLFWKYALNDSLILLAAFEKYREFFLSKFQIDVLRVRKVPTAPAIAIRVLRQMMKCAAMKCEVEEVHKERKRSGGAYGWGKDKRIVLHPSQLLIRHMALCSAWGGRREAFGVGLYDRPVITLDFSGHYNRCGIDQPLPNEHTTWFESSDLETIRKCEGFVEIHDWYFPPNTMYPCISQKVELGSRLIASQSGRVARLTVFELRLAIDHFGLRFQSIHGIVFKPSPNEINHPVREFLTTFRQMKDEAKKRCQENGTEPEDDLEYYLAKLMGNALVGKFLQSVEEESEDLYEFLDYVTRDSRLKRQKSRLRKTASFFAPEWSALILGRARALLGYAFDLAGAITGHTDSVTCALDRKRVEKTIKILHDFGGDLEIKYEADGFWILRSSVYIALTKKPDGSWAIKTIEHRDGPSLQEAHHGLPMDHARQFCDPVIRTLNGKPWVPPKLAKRHLAKVTTQVNRGVPLGWEYTTAAIPKLRWDFKRKMPEDFDIERNVFRRFAWTEPYETNEASYFAEKSDVHGRRIITDHRRPSKAELRKRRRIQTNQLRQRGWSYRAIAREVGVSHVTVKRWADKDHVTQNG